MKKGETATQTMAYRIKWPFEDKTNSCHLNGNSIFTRINLIIVISFMLKRMANISFFSFVHLEL